MAARGLPLAQGGGDSWLMGGGARPGEIRVYDQCGGAFGLEGPIPKHGAPLDRWAGDVATRARGAAPLR